MRVCVCKVDFSIGGNFSQVFFFQEGRSYTYKIKYHEQELETSIIKTPLYYVYIDEDTDIPFTEVKFKDKFDDRCEIRNEKINQIFS